MNEKRIKQSPWAIVSGIAVLLVAIIILVLVIKDRGRSAAAEGSGSSSTAVSSVASTRSTHGWTGTYKPAPAPSVLPTLVKSVPQHALPGCENQPTYTPYSPVDWPTVLPPSPAPGNDGVTKAGKLAITYLEFNSDATAIVQKTGINPYPGEKFVGVKLRVANTSCQESLHIPFDVRLSIGQVKALRAVYNPKNIPGSFDDGTRMRSGETREGWFYLRVPNSFKGGWLEYSALDGPQFEVKTGILVK